MTLHEKIDYIIANLGPTDDDDNPRNYKMIWEKGYCIGFVEQHDVVDGASVNVSFDKNGCLGSYSCKQNYKRATVCLYTSKPIDLTNIKTIELQYIEHYATYGSIRGIGISKNVSTHDSILNNQNIIDGGIEHYAILPNSTSANTESRYQQLDVSDYTGSYFVYVWMGQGNSGPNTGSGKFTIEYIKGYYI